MEAQTQHEREVHAMRAVARKMLCCSAHIGGRSKVGRDLELWATRTLEAAEAREEAAGNRRR